MNIPLKTLLIFCLVTALAADVLSSSTNESPTGATTVTTKDPVETNTGTFTTDTTTVNTPASTTIVTQAPETTSTGTFNTDTTTDSTDNTPASTTAATTTTTTQAPETTSTGTFNTDTTTDSTDNTPASTTAATTTTTTQDPVETNTGTFTTDTTTDNTPASTTIVTQAPETTSTGTFNTDTTTDSTDNTPASTTAATTTTTTQGPCASSPCIGDSTCEEWFGVLFACICRPGLVYVEMTGCIQRKVFPGSLYLNRRFEEEMNDRGSELFKVTAGPIEEALRDILGKGDNGYINSTVLSLSAGSIIAEVQNFYELSSFATSKSVKDMIEAGKSLIPDYKGFTPRNACATGFCDNTTTICDETEPGIATCTCRIEYIKSPSTSQACLACPNGEKATDNSEKCEKCPFGFSGFNCNDSYLLVVVVVSTVLGALLIIFIVALIVVSCRNQKESSSSKVDFSSSYGNKELHKPAGVPRIPRANPDASWKSNNLEMTNSGSNQALVTRDRPESKARYADYNEDMSYRAQIPPAYSGYGGRGVENDGVHNPYFRQDDDRMRRY